MWFHVTTDDITTSIRRVYTKFSFDLCHRNPRQKFQILRAGEIYIYLHLVLNIPKFLLWTMGSVSYPSMSSKILCHQKIWGRIFSILVTFLRNFFWTSWVRVGAYKFKLTVSFDFEHFRPIWWQFYNTLPLRVISCHQSIRKRLNENKLSTKSD